MLFRHRCIDPIEWRCRACNTRKSIRENSFFAKSHLSLDKLLTLLYWWTTDARQSIVRNELQIGRECLVDWYQYIREICFTWVDDHSEQIGGYDPVTMAPKFVEVDESCFMRKKYNRGNDREHHWVFGGNKLFSL